MTPQRSYWCLVLVLVLVLVMVMVEALPRKDLAHDLETAASGHHHGRVQIKVYRGPDEHHGHHDHFAPHGYWVKQPADDHHH